MRRPGSRRSGAVAMPQATWGRPRPWRPTSFAGRMSPSSRPCRNSTSSGEPPAAKAARRAVIRPQMRRRKELAPSSLRRTGWNRGRGSAVPPGLVWGIRFGTDGGEDRRSPSPLDEAAPFASRSRPARCFPGTQLWAEPGGDRSDGGRRPGRARQCPSRGLLSPRVLEFVRPGTVRRSVGPGRTFGGDPFGQPPRACTPRRRDQASDGRRPPRGGNSCESPAQARIRGRSGRFRHGAGWFRGSGTNGSRRHCRLCGMDRRARRRRPGSCRGRPRCRYGRGGRVSRRAATREAGRSG